ncbi:MAG: HAD-IIA family hydrolase [Gemmatimonadota bacterium]|nr:HAD-IIA family hydrolase [Gemmatimonadota bacterium]MDH3367272.1 HAD-IIA family hydrolase [Gemmatimonadota bacterium]MDH3479553.1 HAD-IIA family hydrolase [Gemmatimonadota bacterium]MDH3568715.1 HAD-IIA family hydrolase [Gemmatimonadota bacterium]
MDGVFEPGEWLGGYAIPRAALIDRLAAVLLDVDGTLLTEDGAVPGAAAVVTALRRRGIPFRIVTNITRRSRQSVVDRLGAHGIEVQTDEIYTAVYAAVAWLRNRAIRRVAPFVTQDVVQDLQEFDLIGGTATPSVRQSTPDAVLIGDLGDHWSHGLLNEAFRYVMDGAELVALQRGRYWLGPTGLELDAGAYVAALEYATGHNAVVCGKPNAEFFDAAVASLADADYPTIRRSDDFSIGPIAMVGDDVWSDIQGAQQAGLEGWLVRTGKFREDVLAASGVTPDGVLDSVASLC